jgi:hypothetical protein
LLVRRLLVRTCCIVQRPVSIPASRPFPQLVVGEPLGCPGNNSVYEVHRPIPLVGLVEAEAAVAVAMLQWTEPLFLEGRLYDEHRRERRQGVRDADGVGA